MFFPYDVPEPERTKSGFINTLPGYVVREGTLYPGVYQNVVSPGFDVWYDREGDITKTVQNFDRLLHERLKSEQLRNPRAAFEQSHLRHPLFSPHFIEELD